MTKEFTAPQSLFVDEILTTGRWVGWRELADKFPSLTENGLGEMYKPQISFHHIPPAAGEVVNTAIIATLRLHTGYQDVVMSRPLDPAVFTREAGILRAVELATDAIGDFHAVSSYIVQSGMVS